ncbi:MAG: 4'-phosphopantetheinyl transferase superfamily protein [Verrucomicrobiae bacterium]|nr:4'-phosphopantetheinyl transferase superfamily protein [Verrucomicrobiae bacterium]
MPTSLSCKEVNQGIQVVDLEELLDDGLAGGRSFNFEKKPGIFAIPLKSEVSLLRRCVSLLNDSEKQRANRFRHDGAKAQFITGHAAIHVMLRSVLGEDYDNVEFGESEHRKPFVLFSDGTRPIEFNLSHCADYIAIALGEKPVGIDVEKIRHLNDLRGICGQVFTASEIEEVFAGSDEDAHLEKFFQFWTCKEAALKANGTGFMLDPKRLEVVHQTDSSDEALVYWTRKIEGHFLAWSADLSL